MLSAADCIVIKIERRKEEGMLATNDVLKAAVEEVAEMVKLYFLEGGYVQPAALIMANGMTLQNVIEMDLEGGNGMGIRSFSWKLRTLVSEANPEAVIVVTSREEMSSPREAAGQGAMTQVVSVLGVSPAARFERLLVYRKEGGAFVLEDEIERDAGQGRCGFTQGLWENVN
jgi:hypothetical protein